MLEDTKDSKPVIESSICSIEAKNKSKKDEGCEEIVILAEKVDISAENEKLKAHLEGMQWRVVELENVCKKMQNQMSKMMKSRISSQTSGRSLPRLCS